MKTFHIHIQGIVQGVGFRPFVYKYAKEVKLFGWVNNTNDGVHIHINATKKTAEKFLQNVLNKLPPLAVVVGNSIEEVPHQEYHDFTIIHSDSTAKPNLLVTPDAAMCADCKQELHNPKDRRYHYPFITCTNCGPRYSIIKDLPYDRPKTTMQSFRMCDVCQTEYDNPLERRHYSQTNSCGDCNIEMQLFEKGELIENFADLDYIVQKWEEGKRIAIKGIGGYLVTCDATNSDAIKRLRERKKRPQKPFALMYPNLASLKKDVHCNAKEIAALESIYAPIVLLETKSEFDNKIAFDQITHGLSRLGVMLPYTPLYELLLHAFKKPIIATSANITDSTIIFTNKKAVEDLNEIADIILLNNRKILIPQDDGVVQFSRKHHQKITLRRSRGKAPNYINPKLEIPNKTVFAAGSMLKSVFAFFNGQNTYVSQYMGNTASYDAQLNYEKTFTHFQEIFDLDFDAVVVDKHPDYFATHFGKKIAQKYHAKTYTLQHHKAHFYAVLGEHNLWNSKDEILGVIWDGTGLGDDGNIWGGEFFSYQNKTVKRISHIGEFDFILGDKMPKEPRISALAISHKTKGAERHLKPKFTDTEWSVYQKLLARETILKSTSMGRLFDAVASLLVEIDIHSYEAEASMKLEKLAAQYYYDSNMSLLDSYLKGHSIPSNFVHFIIKSILDDLENEFNKDYIAAKFHITLVDYIVQIAKENETNSIAFSGGVFQNALLVDLLIEFMGKKHKLYFQEEFSPNDEGIPFGQLMYFLSLNDKF